MQSLPPEHADRGSLGWIIMKLGLWKLSIAVFGLATPASLSHYMYEHRLKYLALEFVILSHYQRLC